MIPLTAYQGKKVALFGLGASGMAASLALKAAGAELSAWDDGAAARDTAQAAGIPLTDPSVLPWSDQTALVLAPGVPLTHPRPHTVVKLARAANVPCIGDMELFAQARAHLPDHRVVGITGTNGKSTTTALLTHILQAADVPAVACGNIGTPILALQPLPAGGVYVIELSSYQLDLTHSLACDVAILLNITPDHLDRHGDMAGYVAAKQRLFAQQSSDQLAIVSVDDGPSRDTAARLNNTGRKVIPISVKRAVAGGYYVDGTQMMDGSQQEAQALLDLSTCHTLPGQHNWQNALAAFAAARTLGVREEQIIAGLLSFPGLKHRAELVAEQNGVRFFNDSKATNADATEKALQAFETIYWIAGGRAKAGGIETLQPCFNRIRKAYLIGEAADDFARTLDGKVAYALCGTMEKAVTQAVADATPGSVVLLSPACASFDQYRNFEERGDDFRRHVMSALGLGGGDE